MHGGERRFGLTAKRVLQNLRQACLTFRYPPRVVLTDGLLVIPQQVGDIGNRHALLQQNPREGMAETMRCGWLVERPRHVKHFGDPSAPNVRNSLEPLGSSSDERRITVAFCTC